METPRKGPAGETIDTPRHRALGSPSRVAILSLVRSAAGITAAEVAEHMGQHLSTTRAHLDRLVEAGLLIKARASGGQPGRPAWRYRAVMLDPVPAPAPYRALAAALLENLSRGGGDIRTVVQAGQRWGRQLAEAGPRRDDPLDAVLDVLGALGFDPRRRPPIAGQGEEVHLHTCPFLELVGQDPDTMCGLHLGVVRGILERDMPVASVALEPFGAPSACVVRLMAQASPGARDET